MGRQDKCEHNVLTGCSWFWIWHFPHAERFCARIWLLPAEQKSKSTAICGFVVVMIRIVKVLLRPGHAQVANNHGSFSSFYCQKAQFNLQPAKSGKNQYRRALSGLVLVRDYWKWLLPQGPRMIVFDLWSFLRMLHFFTESGEQNTFGYQYNGLAELRKFNAGRMLVSCRLETFVWPVGNQFVLYLVPRSLRGVAAGPQVSRLLWGHLQNLLIEVHCMGSME